MQFPKTTPVDAPATLWSLQNHLLTEVQEWLGPRDDRWEVCQPSFGESVPHIYLRQDLLRVWAVLSPQAGAYWPTALFEMAHETVQLLDPTAGATNHFEEGVATASSLAAQAVLDESERVAVTDERYANAMVLADELPGAALGAGCTFRRRKGALHAASVEQLQEVFPQVPSALLEKLGAEFPRIRLD